MYEILSNCEDFKNELTQLAFILKQKNILLRLTPKCHPEIAGVGIEYDSEYGKLRFRQHFNDIVAANLRQNVCKTLCNKEVLIMERTLKFARKAKKYKMTYMYLIIASKRVSQNEKFKSESLEKIEKILKMFKQHRSALDQDYCFIRKA